MQKGAITMYHFILLEKDCVKENIG